MEVADEIVVINQGRVEQVGTPSQLYDEPANQFVMGFLGPVTRLRGELVRPHDIEVFTAGGRPPTADAVPAVVERIVSLGFEIRVDARVGEEAVWVQLTRGEAEKLQLAPGDPVHLGAAPHRAQIAATA